MKVHNCVQGTPEWRLLRCGIPTASNFDRILTKGGAKSKSAEKYKPDLLAERLMGEPIDGFSSPWMERGHDLEAEAVKFWEFQTGLESVPVGFITNDAETVGASPDRLVGDMGLLEIKCPAPGTQMAYLLHSGAAYEEYKVQAQGQLWIAERDWTDVVAYHPLMPSALHRTERDDKFISLLEEAVSEFVTQLEKDYAQLVEENLVREPKRETREKSVADIMREALIDAQKSA